MAGWSKFSEPLIINYKTHSELFPAGFLNRSEIKIENGLHENSEDYAADGFEDMEIEYPEVEEKKKPPSLEAPESEERPLVDKLLHACDEKLIRRYVN